MKVEYDFSAHALDMFSERAIPEEWVGDVLNSPDRTEVGEDYNVHYIKTIVAFGGRFLRVVVNPSQNPVRVVTLFFDRRIRI